MPKKPHEPPPPPATPSRLRLRVTAAAESALRSGHPWLFADSIRDQNRPGNLGELAVIYDRQDKFLAVGLFDPFSPLRVRILRHGKPQPIDSEWWMGRARDALQRREGMFDSRTNGYRCIHGENDGWPGLVLDRYGQTFVLKLYTAAWLPRLKEITQIFNTLCQPKRMVLRLSRNIQKTAQEEFAKSDGDLLCGTPVDGPVVFLESGLRFEADVLRGQKTGFFLDQRENRRRIEDLARGRNVLNVFSYSGGFSLYAARGGARTVTDVDLSPHAIAAAERNFALNRDVPGLAACPHESRQAEAFEWLTQAQVARFDLVILDPPSFAKRQAERSGALRSYAKLAALGLRQLKAGGILLACSCSAHVPADAFFDAVRKSAANSGRPFEELATTLHPPDHPATFPAAHYLKGIYLQLGASAKSSSSPVRRSLGKGGSSSSSKL
jgi:23S rRNA (cytosine1962-C5)-methyltransferase